MLKLKLTIIYMKFVRVPNLAKLIGKYNFCIIWKMIYDTFFLFCKAFLKLLKFFYNKNEINIEFKINNDIIFIEAKIIS